MTNEELERYGFKAGYDIRLADSFADACRVGIDSANEEWVWLKDVVEYNTQAQYDEYYRVFMTGFKRGWNLAVEHQAVDFANRIQMR